MIALDLFCGAGGASNAIAAAGYTVIGYERDRDACRTHHNAGHATVRADLAAHRWPDMRGRVAYIHGSPPCQPFSTAGDGAGRDDTRDGMPWFLTAIEAIRPALITVENVPGLTFTKHAAYLAGFFGELRQLGYVVEWRILNAADYGVPQSRKRLIVVGRCDGTPIVWPNATHTDGGGMFLEPWMSMADALGWGMTQRPFLTVAGCNTSGGFDPNGVGGSAARAAIRTERGAGRWHVNAGSDANATRRTIDRPAPTVLARKDANGWTLNRPATTIAGDTRVFQPGGHHEPGEQSANAIRVTLTELARLQAFPDGYPFHGNRTSIARQIGNAVPAPLLAAVLRTNPVTS